MSNQVKCYQLLNRLLDGTPEKQLSKSGKTIQTYYSFGDNRDNLYYSVHKFHPCDTWTMESKSNYQWHYEHFMAMGREYEYRRGKEHVATIKLLGELLKN